LRGETIHLWTSSLFFIFLKKCVKIKVRKKESWRLIVR
jgi:hypothetical protein